MWQPTEELISRIDRQAAERAQQRLSECPKGLRRVFRLVENLLAQIEILR